nr:hypothetical protein BaRGS_013754 [Batillaria attramentaria]
MECSTVRTDQTSWTVRFKGSAGLAFVCTTPFPTHVFPELRYLDASDLLNSKLVTLDLSSTDLTELSTEVFTVFTQLAALNLSHSHLNTITDRGFVFTPNLVTVDVSGNPVENFPSDLFRGLLHLASVKADNYRLCCKTTLPDGFEARLCHAPLDVVSSCEDLVRSELHRAWLLILSLLSSLGNAGCIFVRFFLRDTLTTSSVKLLVTNLHVANYAMSVPVSLIATVDHVYRDRYLAHERWWKTGMGCKVVGFFVLLSTEASVLFIFLITLDRLLVLRVPGSQFCFQRRSAIRACELAWGVAVLVAALSVVLAPPHKPSTQSGICFPLPVSTARLQTSRYDLVVLTVLNPLLFLFVMVGQVVVVWSARGMLMLSDPSHRAQDVAIARRLVIVAVSDFMCWFPTGVVGLMALTGSHIPEDVNMTLAVFVLPLNSALNPFLYVFGMVVDNQRKVKERRGLACGAGCWLPEGVSNPAPLPPQDLLGHC